MIVVSNAGPVIALARINQLNLLKHYFERIYISPEAYEELVVKGRGRPGSGEVEGSEWILQTEVKDTRAVEILRLELDAGEAEAIVLAQEIKADLVLLDESIAREIAKSLGLKVNGSIGILVRATKDGIVERLRPLLDELRAKGVWISGELYSEALRLSGEVSQNC